MLDIPDRQNITVDHQEIAAWAQKFNGRPQRIGENGYSSIRIDFPGHGDDTFFSSDKRPVNISWDEFFRIFEEQHLAFIHEDKDVFDPSLAYHFIKRENAFEEETIDHIFG
ncbi:hypothetical protein M1403_03620 [Patescibacteria group bacterium]|nr:hypothetical protein [Patescibacteria group bacterium]